MPFSYEEVSLMDRAASDAFQLLLKQKRTDKTKRTAKELAAIAYDCGEALMLARKDKLHHMKMAEQEHRDEKELGIQTLEEFMQGFKP